MTKDEALKMALEALEKSHTCPLLPDDCAEAITAIKEALEQPEHGWTPERIAGIARLKDAQDKRLAQPEQNPVAWMDDYNACKCPDNEARCFSDKVFRMMQKHTDSLVKRQEPVAKVCHDLDGHIGWNPNLKQLPNEGTPLYTTPPQRKPEQEHVAWVYDPITGSITPPQRKPLTDEEIKAMYIEKNWYEMAHAFTWGAAEVVARAIEAAHGIKGKA